MFGPGVEDLDVLRLAAPGIDAAAAKKRELRRLGARLSAGTNVIPGVIAHTRAEWDRMGAAGMNWHAEVEQEGVRVL